MSERGSFCTQFIYYNDLAEDIYRHLIAYGNSEEITFRLTLLNNIISGKFNSKYASPTWEFERISKLIGDVCLKHKKPMIEAVFITDCSQTNEKQSEIYSIKTPLWPLVPKTDRRVFAERR